MAYADKADIREKKPIEVPRGKPWETDEEKAVKDKSDDVRFWLRQISKAKAEAKDWHSECKEAWREYQAESLKDGKYRKLVAGACSTYPRFWSDTETMLPAVFSQLPQLVGRKRFEEDPVACTASIVLERFAAYLMDSCCFEPEMKMAALEYLLTNRATCRLYFDAEIRQRPKRISVQEYPSDDPQAPPTYADNEGNLAPDDAVILTDETGGSYYEVDGAEEEVEDPKIYIRALHFDEVYTSVGARNPHDVWWMAFKITTTRKQAHERFGDKIDELKSGQEKKKDDEGEKEKPDDLITFFEIWNMRDEKVLWIHEQLKDDYLDTKDDIYELAGFYPTPQFMVSTPRYDSLFPTPDYTQTKDAYEQLHLLAQRINIITKAIKGVALYDGEQLEIGRLFNELVDGEGIAVSGFKDLLGKGGLDSLIMFPPYERLGQTLQQLIQTFSFWKELIDEIRGIGDIIRGNSDPVTSATAEKIKKQSATNRFSLRQKEMARFVRDVIEMMCDLALKQFSDEQIKDVVGFPYLDPEDQQRFDQALVILRDDQSRLVRIDIETDSLIAVDEQEQKEAANELMAAIGQNLPGLVQSVQQLPQIAEVAFKVFELALSKYRYGKHAEDELKQSFAKLTEKLQAEPPPPPPDPKMMELQMKQQQSQMDAQLEQARLQLENQRLQLDANIAAQKMQLDAQKSSQDTQLQAWMAQLESGVRQAETAIKQQLANLEERKEQFDEFLKSSGMQIDQQQHEQDLQERWATEERLREGLAVEEVKGQTQSQPQPPAPSVMINVQGAQAPQPQPVILPTQTIVPGGGLY